MRAFLVAITAVGVLSFGAAGCGSTADPSAPVEGVPDEFFGVVPQTTVAADDLDRMAEGKVGLMRLVVPWGLIDPSAKQNDLNFSSIDPVVLGAAGRQIRVLPTIYGTPPWVAEGLDGNECDPDCAGFAPQSEEALAAWKQFIEQIVDRYGPEGKLWDEHPDIPPLPVRSWQIWNEQNSPTFYQPEVDPAAYADLLSAASEEITERDPGAEVILGGMFGTPFKGKPPGQSAWDFLHDLYSIDGTADSFDAVAAHPYAAHERLHDEIVRADDDAGMWITEVGASSDEGDNPLLLGPEGQAEQLRTAFQFFVDQRQALDIEGVTWYAWRDTTDPSQCDWCPGSGLFEAESLESKPAWDEFVAFTGGS
jgi:hypothetical protein